MPKLPDNGGKVFRVRQLPSHVQIHELASLLHRALDCTGPIDHIRIFSLAPSIDSIDQHQTKVATIGFVTIPNVFSSDQHEWSFRMPGLAHTIVIDTHFLGFTTLNDVRPENHTVDCFAIPGLASHPFGSWRPHNASSSFMWLRDALPQSLLTARVIIYGYDTNLIGSQSVQSIEDIAISLIAKLRSIGNTLPSARPTMFLAHSLGGIALKQALVHLAYEKRHNIFLSKIKKIIFFGVPNRGMKVAHLLSMVQGRPNESLVQLLREGSEYLSFLDERFSGISLIRKMHLVSVYETQRSQVPLEIAPGQWERNGPFEVLLEKESAIHRFSDSEDIYPVNKDHSSLVKFAEDEPDLKTILNFLHSIDRTLPSFINYDRSQTVDCIGNIEDDHLPPIGKIYDSSYEERSEYREQVTTFLGSLRKYETTRRYDQVSNAHGSTFGWVFEREGVGLVEWLEDDSGLFWICGKPGSGKSTVMKYICENQYEERKRNPEKPKGTAKAKDLDSEEQVDEAQEQTGKGNGKMEEERSVEQEEKEIGEECYGDEAFEAQRSDKSTGASVSVSSGKGREGKAHGEPSGQTDIHFFFSYRGSEIQKSFEGLLHGILYGIMSPGVEARHEIAARRMQLGRKIFEAEADLSSGRMDLSRARQEHREARDLAQKESERQGRKWSERDDRVEAFRQKRERGNEAKADGGIEAQPESIQEDIHDIREKMLMGREVEKKRQVKHAEEGRRRKQSHVDQLRADYQTLVTQMEAPHIWRHENAHLLHSALQERLKLSWERTASWTAADLEAALLQILTQRRLPVRITLFLDALDEYAGNPTRIANLLEHAVKQTKHSKTRLKICFTSRPWDVFKDHFTRQPGFFMQDHTRSDIDNYAKAMMSRHVMADTLSEPVSHSLRSQVVERAEGLFLWVQLVLDMILLELVHGASPEELHRILAAFPDGLEDLYIATLGRIEPRYRKECYIMLEIVLRSESAMKIVHFWVAIQLASSEFDTSPFGTQQLDTQDEEVLNDWYHRGMILRRIQSRCGGLLEIHGGVVQLMHQSVYDFLLHPGTMRHLVESGEKLATFNGHSFLAQVLAIQLSQPEKKEMITSRSLVQEKGHLASMHSCMYHAKQAELSTGMSQVSLVEGIEEWIDLNSLCLPRYTDDPSLAFAVVSDLQVYVHGFLLRTPMEPRPLAMLLHCAVEYHTTGTVTDLSGMVKLLLGFGADSRISMKAMAPFQYLLHRKSQGFINHSTCSDSTLSLARVLLNAPGADPNGDVILGLSPDPLVNPPRNGNDVLVTCKPLHVAGGVAMIRLLLGAGANVNGLNWRGETPLDVFVTVQQDHAGTGAAEDVSVCIRQLRRRGGVTTSPLSGTAADQDSVDARPETIEQNYSRESLPCSTHVLLHPSKPSDEGETGIAKLFSILRVMFCACLRERHKKPMQGQLSSAAPSDASPLVISSRDNSCEERVISRPSFEALEAQEAPEPPQQKPHDHPESSEPTYKYVPVGKPSGNYSDKHSAVPKFVDDIPPDYFKKTSPGSTPVPGSAFRSALSAGIGSRHRIPDRSSYMGSKSYIG